MINAKYCPHMKPVRPFGVLSVEYSRKAGNSHSIKANGRQMSEETAFISLIRV